MSKETRILDRARIAVIVAAAGIAATAVAQLRQAPPTRPPSVAPAVQPIPGGPPNPYLIEIGTLKQRVAALEQIVQALQKESATLRQKTDRVESLASTVRQELQRHTHPMNLGFTTWKSVNSNSCPDCMVAFTTPGKAPTNTGPAKF